MSMRLGVDLGGTKVELIALDGDGRELLRRRVATPQGDYLATLETVVALIRDAETVLGAQGSVGVGTPGAVSHDTGRLKNSNSVCLNDRPIQDDLERLLERPVRIANDANCFALSEAVDGSGSGHAVVFGVIIGTGTGAGVVVNGQVLEGVNGIAGEWGHNPLPWSRDEERPGPPCYCGKRGCIETFLSGPGLARDHALGTDGAKDVPDIVAGAAAGVPECTATLRRYEDRLARALAHVINILDPEVIVLGGGMSNISSLYSNVPQLWGTYVFSDRVDTRLLPPRHGDSGGVRGAAWLWSVE
jgi:predicted NBD/HSP70 family sugar kinase